MAGELQRRVTITHFGLPVILRFVYVPRVELDGTAYGKEIARRNMIILGHPVNFLFAETEPQCVQPQQARDKACIGHMSVKSATRTDAPTEQPRNSALFKPESDLYRSHFRTYFSSSTFRYTNAP